MKELSQHNLAELTQTVKTVFEVTSNTISLEEHLTAAAAAPRLQDSRKAQLQLSFNGIILMLILKKN